MAGLCHAGNRGEETGEDAAWQEIAIPIHFHTHDTSGNNAAASVLKAAEAGVHIADGAVASMRRADQPAEPEFGCGGTRTYQARGEARSRRTKPVLGLLGDGARILCAVRHRPERAERPKFICSEMPGGQYTGI